ncbi:unnamed protein product, partial [Brachionus calyciflorus]
MTKVVLLFSPQNKIFDSSALIVTGIVMGTFDGSPTLFKQVYTIHIIIRVTTLPMVYALLANKKQTTYKNLFKMVKNLTFRLVQSLPFIPSEDVSKGFNYIKTNAPKSALLFLTYIENNYIGVERSNARFQVDIWNLYERVKRDLPRTNNNVESWNSRIKPDAKKNLTVAKVVELFRLEQNNMEMYPSFQDIIDSLFNSEYVSSLETKNQIQYDSTTIFSTTKKSILESIIATTMTISTTTTTTTGTTKSGLNKMLLSTEQMVQKTINAPVSNDQLWDTNWGSFFSSHQFLVTLSIDSSLNKYKPCMFETFKPTTKNIPRSISNGSYFK